MLLPTTTTGDGPRRIGLVHGLGASGALWRGLEELLVAGGASVTTVDLRGHGAAPRADSYRIADFADDLVESLPTGLDVLVGHSLGGAVVRHAVERLRPAHALYLDPGFELGLPHEGLAARAFWALPPVALVGMLLIGRRRERGLPPHDQRPHSAADAALVAAAKRDWDRGMALRVFRDAQSSGMLVAEPPGVPSTVLLSRDGPRVLPDRLRARLAELGWAFRDAPSVAHEMWLEDADATLEPVRDILLPPPA